MAKLQKHFELFHNRIRVSTEPLTEKRDIILNVIRKYLREKGLPSFELVNQGSYIYGVGIKPTGDNEYDIDVGLAFNIKTEDYPDARVVRKWILEAVDGHTSTPPKDRGPCIRVHYAKGFHVDLVVYAKYTDSKEIENLQLGKKDGTWNPSDPKGLKSYIKKHSERFSETKVEGEANQLQRTVRYLKRWNDLRIPNDSDDTGIALLLLAIEKLEPTVDSWSNEPDDLTALLNFCIQAIPYFSDDRITVKKPTPEFEDVFGRISDDGMTSLINALKELKEAAAEAKNATYANDGAKKLSVYFGSDFPVEEEIKKSEVINSLRLDETDVDRLAKIEALKSMASTVSVGQKPWFPL